ncbi:MAG: DUF389 domain-containing protein [Gemmatimonadota bacterium]
MIHLRLIVPPDLVHEVLGVLERAPDVTNVWRLPNAATKPAGDLVSCDVAKEEGSSVVAELRALGLGDRGSIAVESVDASVSDVAVRAELAAPGAPADAIVWEEVQGRVEESATLSVSFLLLMTIATMISAIGIITDSIVLIIGGMVVGPEFGPLAGISVALVEGRPRLAARSLQALAVGFPLAIAGAAFLTLVLIGTGVAPDALLSTDRELTLFISDPNWASAIVAVLAGAVGMLALTGAKSGVLVGVLISVTTLPAASNVGVAAVYGNWSEAGGAAAQLAINVTAIAVTGVVVLLLDRRAQRRRELARARSSRPAR